MAGLLKRAGDATNAEAARWIAGMEPAHRRIVGYQLGLWDARERPGGTAGKAVRAALTLTCARAAGGEPGAALRGAVAVELLHNLSLLYDDAMDRDAVRRARPAAWRVFGRQATEQAADALLPLAVARLFDPPAEPETAGVAASALGEAVVRLVQGQALDLGFERRREVGVEECRWMLSGKTASLMACACRLGAVFAGAGPELTAGFTRLGEDLGMVFQLRDDVLGIWGDPSVTGKPGGSDLTARKKSFPVVAALSAGTPDAHRLADAYATTPAPTRGPGPGHGPSGVERPTELAELRELIERLGGRERTVAESQAHLVNAHRFLDGLRATGDGRVVAGADDLAALGDFFATRPR
ncbi:polyprenyl synthetase family protein [Streptomyces sp. NPDC051567]|uniref:polyprenyl synthetase family protein n=1 Tax=Streptomyces sp. NPDC051567 TaxID=3365660 RepID=UPI0037AFFD2F